VERRPSGVLVLKSRLEHMFLGQYRHNLDEKGRLTIPARLRESFVDGAFLTQGFDRNLRLLTEAAFTALYQKLSQLNTTDPTTRDLRRLLLANAQQVEIDKIGRILVPQFLREFAGLENEAVIVGVGDSVEIWSQEAWEAQALRLQDADANSQRFAAVDLSL
jgi:MraZ protein